MRGCQVEADFLVGKASWACCRSKLPKRKVLKAPMWEWSDPDAREKYREIKERLVRMQRELGTIEKASVKKVAQKKMRKLKVGKRYSLEIAKSFYKLLRARLDVSIY